MQATYDIVIVGGGMVGLALACALAQETALSIAVLEAQAETPSWTADVTNHRVSAIALSSQRIFQSLKIWQSMKAMRVSPFKKIHVWDKETKNSDIEFASNDIAESFLGYIIENNVMQAALHEKILAHPNIHYLAPIRLASFAEDENKIKLVTENGDMICAPLAIAADGAHSWLRDQSGISVDKKEYEQQAIVATVRTEKKHELTARQVFLDTGPLAFLPLADEHMCSIVWSLPLDEATHLLAMNVDGFNQALTQAFANVLGEVELIGVRHSFPLRKQQAMQYVRSRVVLVGDAAHAVHPLAGQGVNMGLLDAMSLVDVIVDSLKLRRDFASHDTLRRYERWRKADNQGLLVGVDVIKQLFASQNEMIKSLRSCGLNMTQQLPLIKNVFTRHAVGNRENLPKLALVETEPRP